MTLLSAAHEKNRLLSTGEKRREDYFGQEREKYIVAKALDGQRYPMSLSKLMSVHTYVYRDEVVRVAEAPQGPSSLAKANWLWGLF